jgi:hypothetical protein
LTGVDVSKLDPLLHSQRRALNQHQGSKDSYPEPRFARSKVGIGEMVAAPNPATEPRHERRAT